jgi:hypothetical protein
MPTAIVNRIAQELATVPNVALDPAEYTQYTINDIWVSVVESEVTRYEWMLTSHPVESGVNVSDHKERLPVSIDLNGYIISDPVGGTEDWIQKRDSLIKLANSDEIISLQTPTELYEPLQIRSYEFEPSYRYSNGCKLKIVLGEFRITTVGATEITDTQVPRWKRIRKKQENVRTSRYTIKNTRTGKVSLTAEGADKMDSLGLTGRV